MSQLEKGQVDCPFSGHGADLINVKFFRGRRDDIITVEELKAEAQSAENQRLMKTATISATAPTSLHHVIDVREFAAHL
ncbi:hypothetical protein NUH86_10835 [Sphingobium sp. JS3065]|uniref:hypothetical protein n=1 Tax=Sphingobium sp. JS3065 TaxID=2970925 RepID=UPI0022642FAE|nr:hypothetical protein [Sphingobium sp. JS3065]UZW54030.1 hypothetical protein NUH86_10835 [Sphingobium sp. JS3065]